MMSTHKQIDKICCCILVFVLLLTIVFMNAGRLGVQAVAHIMGYESGLFDPSVVHTIDIEMEDWDSFLESCMDEEYTACSLVIDQEVCKNVAIRAKGNTSLTSVASYGNNRYSFKVEFDHYDQSNTYYGLDKLCLNNIIQDNTYMKDYVTYQMMYGFGVDAPLCSFAYITVNGEDFGLYLAVEGVEESFLERNYGNDYGELYKPDSMSMGGGRGNGADFAPEDMDGFRNQQGNPDAAGDVSDGNPDAAGDVSDGNPDAAGDVSDENPEAAENERQKENGEPPGEAEKSGEEMSGGEEASENEITQEDAVPPSERALPGDVPDSMEGMLPGGTGASGDGIPSGNAQVSAEGVPPEDMADSAEGMPPGDMTDSAEGMPPGDVPDSMEGMLPGDTGASGNGMPPDGVPDIAEGMPPGGTGAAGNGMPSGGTGAAGNGMPSGGTEESGNGVPSGGTEESGNGVPSDGVPDSMEGIPSGNAEDLENPENDMSGEVSSSAEEISQGDDDAAENPVPSDNTGNQGDHTIQQDDAAGMNRNNPNAPGGQGRMSMASEDVSLIYTDDEYDSYSNIFDSAKTEITDSDRDRLIASLKKLNEGTDIENVVDVEEVIRYFVVHNFVCNFDSYTGSMIHNYYLYEKDGQFSMIPWDYNLAFGGFESGTDAQGLVNYPIDSPVSGGTVESRPMLAWIFASEEYTELYHQYFAEFIEQYFTIGEFENMVNTVSEMIAPYVEKDPTKFCSYEEFEEGISTLKSFCVLRAESIKGQLEGTISSTDSSAFSVSEEQQAGDSDTVEAANLSIEAMGTMGNHFGGENGLRGPASEGEEVPGRTAPMPEDFPENTASMPEEFPENTASMPEEFPGNTAPMPEEFPGNTASMPEEFPGNTAPMPEEFPGNTASMPEEFPENTASMPEDFPGNTTPTTENFTEGAMSGNEDQDPSEDAAAAGLSEETTALSGAPHDKQAMARPGIQRNDAGSIWILTGVSAIVLLAGIFYACKYKKY